MQIARGRSVIESSLLTLPMMAGVLGSSTIVGQLISRRGKWKSYVVAGSISLLIGLVLMGQLRADTSLWYVGISMFVLGCGVGMTMQNLVLVVQNTVSPHEMGAASSAVTFFRTLGGSAGMSVMGTLLAHRVTDYMSVELKRLAVTNPDAIVGSERLLAGAIPRTSELSPQLRAVVEEAYGHGIGDIFLAVAPIAVLAIVASILLPNIALSTLNNAQRRASRVSINTGQIEVVELGDLGDDASPATPPVAPRTPQTPPQASTGEPSPPSKPHEREVQV
jgi:MFS family permease